VFVLGANGQPVPTPVRLGLSDGRFVEVLEGLNEGDAVVTGTEEPGALRATGATAPGNNPFAPQRIRPRTRG
jgi:multidrug efflux pump subunit AcrA (membrane-fusion protein)